MAREGRNRGRGGCLECGQVARRIRKLLPLQGMQSGRIEHEIQGRVAKLRFSGRDLNGVSVQDVGTDDHFADSLLIVNRDMAIGGKVVASAPERIEAGDPVLPASREK